MKQSLFTGLAGLVAEPHGDLVAVCERIAGQLTTRWPAWLDGHRFATHLAARLDPGFPTGEALAPMWAEDLYLACAVGAGVAAAVVVFDRQLVAALPATLRRVDPRPDAIDDVTQMLREKLLLPRDGSLRLAGYSGHEPLDAWMQGAALRLALTRRRRRHPLLTPGQDLEAILGLAPNADIRDHARGLGGGLQTALRAAVAAQPERTRAVMRLYYAERHSVEEIGRAHQVHVATVSRWLATGRRDVLALGRADLVDRQRVEPAPIDLVLGHAVVVELTLESVLRSSSMP